jgi:DNA-binding response OmpR family regulator/predicted regulator of Ras-like GTPase activity (Roadblock/LC7/MglB family)
MKNILLVDDEKSFLLSLEEMLKDSAEKYSVQTANNGKEAVNIIEKGNIDLVVTDLKMPEMDGFDLIAYISGSKPTMPVIAMTAFGTPDMENRLMEMGAFQYIEKPIDFPTLLGKIKGGLSKDSGKSDGRVAGISIASFIQLLELDRKTCTLNVTCEGQKGTLYILDGDLLDATFDVLEGQEAALEIISWENVEIEIKNTCKKTEKVIDVPLGFILLESARVRDERGGIKEEEPEEIKPPPAEPKEKAAAPPPPPPKKEEPARVAVSPEIPTTGNHDIDSILAVDGANKVIIISRDGTIIAQKNSTDKQFGTFTAYVAIAGEQFKKNMGFNGPKHIILTQTSGEKILVIPGPNIVAGIVVASGITPEALADKIRPAVAQAKVK